MKFMFDHAHQWPEAGCRLLFERNPLPTLVYDVDTLVLLAVNPAAAAYYGYNPANMLTLRWPDLHPEQDLPQLTLYLELPAHERNRQRLWRHRTGDGQLIDVEVDSEDIALKSGPARIVWVRDVALNQLPERRAGAERDLLYAVFSASNNAIITADTDGIVQAFSPGAEHIFGVSSDSMKNTSLDRLLPKRFRHTHTQHLRDFALTHASNRMMGLRCIKGLHSNGQELDLEATISTVNTGGKQLLIAVLRDITSRVQADVERQKTRTQLSNLANKLMQQEKDLVKRMASAMHDHLGQTLATIRMVHDAMLMTGKAYATPELARLDEQLGRLIKQAVQQVRQVLIDLHPPLLDEHGLAAALDNELRNRALTAIHTSMKLDVQEQLRTTRWPTAVEYATFMIAREAVENALRHSQASQITVLLRGGALFLQLEVHDNGVGFDSDGITSIGHLGITGMRERANWIGATLSLDAGERGGTRVCLRWEPSP